MICALLRSVAATTVLGLLLVSCSDGDGVESSDASPSVSPSASSTVGVPEGVSLTDGGAELAFGDSATVVFEPNQRRGTVLELTVDKVAQGSLDDFSGFILDGSAKSSTPYYVDVSVENLGNGEVGGFAVPLYGVDDSDLLRQAATFTTSFQRCESEPLPERFKGGDTFQSCLVYLVPKRGTLEAVSFRPTQAFDPITWTGDIRKPASRKPDKPKKPTRGKNSR